MNQIINEPLRTYDIHVKPELQELAVGVLLTNGLNSFEEIETQEGLVGFRIWTSPTLSQSDIKSWFTPLLVNVIAHKTTEVPMALNLSDYSHRFRLVNQPRRLKSQHQFACSPVPALDGAIMQPLNWVSSSFGLNIPRS